jgi:O-antigen/teichoic acid export membrane protein
MLIKKLKNLFSTDNSFQQKTVRSGFWSFVNRFSAQGLSLLKIIIVARLLLPEDFGLFGISLLILSILKVFTNTGFQESIIQNKNNVLEHLNTAWTTLIIRGAILYAILFLSAPIIAGFFNEPRAGLIIQVIGLTLVLEGFQNIAIVFLKKELEFHKRYILELGEMLPSFILTVSLAFILKSVWALVYGSLIGGVGILFLSYLVHPYRPKFEFKKDKAAEMFTFGKWILGSSILTFILTQGDDIFVGKILGATALGFYLMAYHISNLSATEITHTISNVIFPAYSKLQDNLSNLRFAYEKTLQLTVLLSFPIGGLIFSLSSDFTYLILGEKWISIIPAMQVLVIYGLNRSIGATTGPLFQGFGKPNIVTKLQLIQLILFILLLYPLTVEYGIMGTAIAITISAIALRIPTTIILCNIIKWNYIEYFKMIFPQLIGTISMIIIILLIKSFISIEISFFSIISLGITGILTYIICIYIFDKFFNYDSLFLIKNIFRYLFKKESLNI